MQSLATFHLGDMADTFVSLASAFVLGTVIGAERQYRQRTAGLRTNALIAVGAAAFVDLAMDINGNPGATQVLAYVVSGVGFLGAGVILKEGTNVRGLNTAATVWCSAAVGGCAGADRVAEAIVLTMFVLAVNTFLRPLVNFIERIPINEKAAEATYQVHVTVNQEMRDDVRDLLVEKLDAAAYPVREIEVLERGEDEVELIATLAPTSVDAGELDAITTALEEAPGVAYATWTSRTTD
ncbi:MgtC/SapB family protein [Methyloferula stellata]|uniref:MgtC/SapB family protein n=1 Tax=Methyloferula stellata TaxID=876270 RepID=UPI0003681D54|nr:MgtC/SapB family protein [Methyloferula stellata]